MNKKHATLLWEDVLGNDKGDNVIKKYNLNRAEVRVFLSHTKPEMFVSDEINTINLLEIKKLKQKVRNISNVIKKKKFSSLMFNIMFICYFFTIFPILSLIFYIKYIP